MCFMKKASDNFPRGITYGSTCQTSSTCTNVKSPGLTPKKVLGDVYSGLKGCSQNWGHWGLLLSILAIPKSGSFEAPPASEIVGIMLPY